MRKNIARHATHAIASWSNPRQWLMILIFDLIFPQWPKLEIGKLKTYCIKDNWENGLDHRVKLYWIYLNTFLYVHCFQVSFHNDDNGIVKWANTQTPESSAHNEPLNLHTSSIVRQETKTITLTSLWPRWRLKSPASRLLITSRCKGCTLQWRHNELNGVSNHQPHDCLLNRLFRRRSKKTSKLLVTGLCVGNSPGPVNSTQRASYTENVSIWWRYHAQVNSGINVK